MAIMHAYAIVEFQDHHLETYLQRPKASPPTARFRCLTGGPGCRRTAAGNTRKIVRAATRAVHV